MSDPATTASEATVGERRQVTVLFADMAGFTAIAERIGEEGTYALMRQVYALMAEAIRAVIGFCSGQGKEREMYEAFDRFLERDTWHTRHPNDERRFREALRKVVKNPLFSPDEMGEYMRQKTRGSVGVTSHPFEQAIDHYVAEAWAIKDWEAEMP